VKYKGRFWRHCQTVNLFNLINIEFGYKSFIYYESDHSKQNVCMFLVRNLQLYKQKIKAAKKGHELLKRKADALKKKFKEVMKNLL